MIYDSKKKDTEENNNKEFGIRILNINLEYTVFEPKMLKWSFDTRKIFYKLSIYGNNKLS